MPIFNFKSWRRQSQQACSGFFLLETAITLCMMAFMISILALSLGNALHSFAYVRERVASFIYARSALERLLFSKELGIGEQTIQGNGCTLVIVARRDIVYKHYVHIEATVWWAHGSYVIYTGVNS